MEYYEFKKEDAYEFARASRIQTKQRGDELQFLSCPYCRGGKNGDKGTFSISLVTGQFKCLRSSCSVSGNIITLARDFDYFSLGKDIDAYYQTGKQKRFRRFKKMENINQSTEDNELEYLLSTIEKAIQQYGIQLVLLDNLMTALDIGLDIDLYRAQSKFVDKLVKISKNYNVAVILVVHPRKNSLGADDNDVVSGSSDITNKVDVVMTYKRDKTLSDDERLLTISKNRLTGKLAIGAKAIKLYFDESSKRISDNRDDFRRPYGWEEDSNGFMPVADMEQMEIPFD